MRERHAVAAERLVTPRAGWLLGCTLNVRGTAAVRAKEFFRRPRLSQTELGEPAALGLRGRTETDDRRVPVEFFVLPSWSIPRIPRVCDLRRRDAPVVVKIKCGIGRLVDKRANSFSLSCRIEGVSEGS
jgi:hypothetical protein